VNAGYFAFGQGPVSYAKGREGYESPSGNVKGPRGCFWFDEVTGNSGVELSWGREKLSSGWGEGLFLHATDVLCAGPVLVRDGSNVVTQQFEVENFQTSGISPDSALPRTALCRMADSSILVLTAQNETVKARGFTLGALADYLVARGCQDALNLDGGGSVAFWSSVDPAGYWPGTEDRPVYQTVVVR
jgi:exopolysaccharide biosynthesis protein